MFLGGQVCGYQAEAVPLFITMTRVSNKTLEMLRILVRQVHLAQGRFRAASNSLEQALSFNFQVGKSPVYLLVKASVEKEEGKLEEALETFEEALR